MTRQRQEYKIEVLAPAGSYDSFLAAVHAGADAVYLGGTRFGARAFADNFTEERLKKAIDYAHLHGRKLYLTVNTLLKDLEMEELHGYLEPLYLHGLDAVIVQDAGVLWAVRSAFPGMEIHASTQMSITNVRGARFLEEQVVCRVVPARELSLEEIRQIAEGTELDVECFVHGALCYSYSGQCLLSSLIGGRSGNRGQCAQPCRLPYMTGESRRKEYVLSPKDICTLDLIPEMIGAGINSFKIEGRMKRPQYVAAVVSVYRKYVDLYLKNGKDSYQVEDADRRMLMDLYNRGGFSQGYYRERNGRDMISLGRPNHAGVPAVRVLAQRGRELTVEALTEIYKGDIVEMTADRENYTFGQGVLRHRQAVILCPKGRTYKKGTVLHRIRCQKLWDEMDAEYVGGKLQREIYGYLRAAAGEPAALTVCLDEESVTVISGQRVEEAQTLPMEEERVRRQICKTGNTDFVFSQLDIELGERSFLPMQQFNEMRRQALDELRRAVCARFRRERSSQDETDQAGVKTEERLRFGKASGADQKTGQADKPYLSVLTETKEQLEAVLQIPGRLRVYIDSNIEQDLFGNERLREICCTEQEKQIFLAMPHIFREDAAARFEACYDRFLELARDGVLIRNYESFQFLKDHGFDRAVILDHNLYVFNRQAKRFWKEQKVTSFTAPMELNEEELSRLDIRAAELVVYGRIPVMISAQCLVKTEQGCTHRPSCTMLTDRTQKRFPVKNHCGFCYNVIYNSDVLSLFDQRKSWADMEPAGIRLQFTTETGSRTREVTEAARILVKRETEFPPGEEGLTRGHFKRGIR